MLRTFAGVVLCSCVFVARLSAADRIDLRVLYCGDPGSAREADFQSFLQQHFTSVALVDGTDFKEEQANKADVVIFDWTNTFKGDSAVDTEKLARMRKTLPALSENYARPSILIGERGGFIGQKLKLKINFLCACLDGPAHRLTLNHSLFHTPLDVKPEFEEIPTRAEYPELTIDTTLGPTMKVWRVQTKDYPEIDPGLVSDLYGFADSPDSEVIAQGISQKGPDTLALGRQANFFLWGFSAPPADMTPSGQRLFVNVVAYMRRFSGQTPLVHKASNLASSREWALRYALLPVSLTPEAQARWEKKYREVLGKFVTGNPELLPEDAQNDPQAYINERVKQLQETSASLMAAYHPEALRKQFGMDSDKYSAYYTENLEYLYLQPDAGDTTRPFLVDEDAKLLGTSNRQVASLDKWVSMVEDGNQPELALRLLKRYTQKAFDTADQWRAWLEKYRKQLFFSDVGGFKFFVAPVARTVDIPQGADSQERGDVMAKQQHDARIVKLFGGAELLNDLTATTKAEAYRLQRSFSISKDGKIVEPDKSKPKLGGRVIDSGPLTLDNDVSQPVVALLLDPNSYRWDRMNECEPEPGVAFRFSNAGSPIDVLICLECDILSIYRDDKFIGHRDFKPTHKQLAQIIKKIYPDDAAIQQLK